MSTRELQKVLRDMQCDYTPCQPTNCRKHEAMAELEAIRKAAKDLARLHVADFTDNIAHRDNVVSGMTTPESQWDHPDVRAWSEAATLISTIAKEAS